jgi:hypothetical protein
MPPRPGKVVAHRPDAGPAIPGMPPQENPVPKPGIVEPNPGFTARRAETFPCVERRGTRRATDFTVRARSVA